MVNYSDFCEDNEEWIYLQFFSRNLEKELGLEDWKEMFPASKGWASKHPLAWGYGSQKFQTPMFLNRKTLYSTSDLKINLKFTTKTLVYWHYFPNPQFLRVTSPILNHYLDRNRVHWYTPSTQFSIIKLAEFTDPKPWSSVLNLFRQSLNQRSHTNAQTPQWLSTN